MSWDEFGTEKAPDWEYQDEMERRGDSLLDEEEWRRDQDKTRWWVNLSAFAQRDVILRWGPQGTIVAEMTQDEARNLANAILSEIEISQREESGDW